MSLFSFIPSIMGLICSGSLFAASAVDGSAVDITRRSPDIPNGKEVESQVASCFGEWKSWNPKDSYSTDLPQTALLGNGDVGIISAGSGMEKSYLISKSDFWSCGNLKGNFSGGEDNKTKPLPIGGVTIRPVWEKKRETDSSRQPERFYEKLDILHACLETEFTQSGGKLQMNARMMALENLLVIELKSSQTMNLEIDVWSKQDNSLFPAATVKKENSIAVSRRTCNSAPENTESWISEALLAPRILDEKAVDHWEEKAPGRISRMIHLEPEQSMWLVVAVGGGGRTYDHKGKLKNEAPLRTIRKLMNSTRNSSDVQARIKSHNQWWSDYWAVSSISLDKTDEDCAAVERYYLGARYLMGAGIRSGKIAPGLYGIWHSTDTPKWSSDYHLNYNFIASFYGAPSSNLCDMLLPPARAMLDAEREGTKRAGDPDELKRINRDYVSGRSELRQGIRDAVLYPVGIGPWGTVTDDSYHNELLNASYSSWPVIQYYEYTLDRDFLKGAYGYLKKCARLYETWLEKKEGGRLALIAGYNEGSWAENPAIELGTAKMLFSFLVRASVVLNQDTDRRAVWEDILKNLPHQPVAEWKGRRVFALADREWKDNEWKALESPVHFGGNILPLDSVLPAGILGYYSPAAEHEIAWNTLEAFGDGAWGQMNNFPRIFYDAVQVRYPAEKLLKHMSGIVKRQMGNNFVVRDGYHGMEKAGATAAVNSMLVLSHQGIVKIFPNWPEDKNASFARLRVPGGFLVSASYDAHRKEVTRLEVTSLLGGKLTVAHPWKDGSVSVMDSKGNVDALRGISDPERKEQTVIIPQTQAGETYIFRK